MAPQCKTEEAPEDLLEFEKRNVQLDLTSPVPNHPVTSMALATLVSSKELGGDKWPG